MQHYLFNMNRIRTIILTIHLRAGYLQINNVSMILRTCVLSVFLVLSGLLTIGYAETYGDYTYSTDGVSISIDAYNGLDGIVIIPDTIEGKPVTRISYLASIVPARLKSVFIPATVTSIGDYVFWNCSNLIDINVDKRNTTYSTTNGVLFNKGMTMLLRCPGGKTGSFLIPNNVTGIMDNAFLFCSGLTNIIIPSGVSSIGSAAFANCTGLTDITIPTNITIIEGSVFSGCGGLTNVVFGNSITNIGIGAFYDCTNLTSITIPKSVTSIALYAFIRCTGLRNVTFTNGITSIGDSAFAGCAALTNITLPDGFTSIGSGTFDGCRGLEMVNLPNSVTNIDSRAFLGCSSLTSITIPNNIAILNSSVFMNCKGLISVTIPNSVGVVGDEAFSGCTLLESVTIPNANIWRRTFFNCTNLTKVAIGHGGRLIYDEAFAGCNSLVSITIPGNITWIGEQAFSGCTSLANVLFEGNAPTHAPDNVFNYTTNVTVYYRAGTIGWGTVFAGRPTALWQPSYQEWAQTSGLLEKFPDASRETDDADHDGLNNLAEMQAGSDPTKADSALKFEGAPLLENLAEEDKTAIGTDQHALYFQTVPGKKYEIQSTTALSGTWQTETNVSATTTQKRVLVNKPANQEFYRVVLVP